MNKKSIYIITGILIGLIMAVSLIFITRATPLFNYHGIKTSYQLRRSQINYTQRHLDFNRIKLAANLPVVIKTGHDNQVKVVSQSRQHVITKVKNRQLIITSTADRPIKVWHWPFLKPNTQGLTNNYVQVTVKSSQFLKRLIRMDPHVNGPLFLHNLDVKHLILNGSGDLNFDQVWSNHQFLINSRVGNIRFRRVKGTMLNLTTSKGTIDIRYAHFKKRPSQIIADNSAINLWMDDWNKLWAKSNEGNLTFAHQNSKHLFKLLTTNGNISGKIDYPSVAFINYFSVNGNVNIFHNLPNDWARYYSFYSDNGDITIKRGDQYFPTWVRHTNF